MGLREDVIAYIRGGETDEQTLGLEIEHFLIDDNGDQIGFDMISSFILRVGKELNAKIHYMDGYPVGYQTDTYLVSLEPSCQFEISVNPYSDLKEIREVYDSFRRIWDPIIEGAGYHFETKGNLPKVETGEIQPDEIPLSPKKRYQYMNAYFEESGRYGKYMMRASASAQISVDYASEEDMARKLLLLQKAAPLLMLLLENKTEASSTLPEHPNRPHLLRIQEWDDLDPARTGFFAEAFDPKFGYEDMADIICHTPLILLTDRGETRYVASDDAYTLVEKNKIHYQAADEDRKKALIEHFMSMGFFHFRVKKYIEIRVADSAEIEVALGYVALIKGLLYNEEALQAWEAKTAEVDSVEELNRAVNEIEKYGNAAKIYDGRTAEAWIEDLLSIAEQALSAEDREYLKHVRTAWRIRQSKD